MKRSDRTFSSFRNSILILLLVNLVLSSLKLFLGYAVESSALRSDGWNNAADFVYTLLLAGGIWISSQPADERHPEGYGRFESIVGLVVSIVIFSTGLFVLWDAYSSLVSPKVVELSNRALALVIISIFAKGATGWFLLQEGERLKSSPLKAIGRDQSGDMLADAAVIAAMLATVYNLHWLDPAVAGLIGCSILYIGWEPFTKNLRDLTGRAPSNDLRPKIESMIRDDPILMELTSFRAHHVGPTVHVSITTKAPGELQLQDVHEVEEALREKILDLPEVSRAFIHVEPPRASSPN